MDVSQASGSKQYLTQETWISLLVLIKKLLSAIPKNKRYNHVQSVTTFLNEKIGNHLSDELTIVDKNISDNVPAQPNILEELKQTFGDPVAAIHLTRVNLDALDNLITTGEIIKELKHDCEYFNKKSLLFALELGRVLEWAQILCSLQRISFTQYLGDCGMDKERSTLYLYMKLHKFFEEYPRLYQVNKSLHYLNKNFNKIKIAIYSSSPAEKIFWRQRIRNVQVD